MWRSENTKQYVSQDRLQDVNTLPLNIPKSCHLLDVVRGSAPQHFSILELFPAPQALSSVSTVGYIS